MKPAHFLFLSLLMLALSLEGQAPLERLYTAENGLAATETIRALRDKLGYLWVMSPNGLLSRFDGEEFQTYPITGEGAVNINILTRLKDGEVLAYNQGAEFDADHAILRGDSILPLIGLPPVINLVSSPFYGDRYCFFTRDTVYGVAPHTLTVDTSFAVLATSGDEVIRSGHLYGNGDFYYSLSGSVTSLSFIPGNSKARPLPILVGNQQRINELPDGRKVLYDADQPVLYLYTPNNQFIKKLDFRSFVSDGSTRFEYYLQGRKPYFFERTSASIRIFNLNVDAEQALSEIVTFSHYDHLAQNFQSESIDFPICWVPSHNGLYWNDYDFLVFNSKEEEMISSLHAISETTLYGVMMGGYGTGFSSYDGKTLRRLVTPELHEQMTIMPGSFKDENGKVLFLLEGRNSSSGILHVPTKGKPFNTVLKTRNKLRNLAGYGFTKVSLPVDIPLLAGHDYPPGTDTVEQLIINLSKNPATNDFPAAGSMALIDLPVSDNPTIKCIDAQQGVRVRNVLCSTQDKGGRIWFGHPSTGIGVYDPPRDTAITWLNESLEDKGAVTMITDHRDRLWFGARTGLYFIDGASSIALQPTPHLRSRIKKCRLRDVPDGYITSMLLRGDTLIIGHTGGVSFLDLSIDTIAPPAITLPLPEYGLGSSEQNALMIDNKGFLWVGTDEGAVRINYRSVLGRNRRMQGEVIIAVQGNLGPVTAGRDGNFTLPKADRSLSFSADFDVEDKMTGIFRADLYLQNAQGDTLDHKVNVRPGEKISVSYLEPGCYEMTIRLYADNKLLSERIATVSVPYFLPEIWWFWPLVVGALLAMVILIIRLQRSQDRQRLQQLENELTKTKLEMESEQVSTLINTINPHFLANAIQWMQSAAATKRDPEEIYRIGHSLSQNMRAIFTKSADKQLSHTLAEELKLVGNYFDIVNIEYEGRYNFYLPDEAALGGLAGRNIFLLQLQIHAENAVERGLLNRPKGNQVVITVADTPDELIITIEDDGVGATRAKELRDVVRTSTGIGTSILTRLATIFDARNKRKLTTVMNSDLYAENDGTGNRYGTRITITIPNNYTYDLESPGSGG